jgi:hypothetical protein
VCAGSLPRKLNLNLPVNAVVCSESTANIRELLESNTIDPEPNLRAIEYICDLNRIVDLTEPFTSAAHFDDEAFDAGAMRIKSFLAAAQGSK